MWVNRVKYENLKNTAEDNEHDANLFRNLLYALKVNKIYYHSEFVIMNTEAYGTLYEEACKYKEIQAELEWYKVKYHEMKMNEK